jgi:hypothetical protein
MGGQKRALAHRMETHSSEKCPDISDAHEVWPPYSGQDYTVPALLQPQWVGPELRKLGEIQSGQLWRIQVLKVHVNWQVI